MTKFICHHEVEKCSVEKKTNILLNKNFCQLDNHWVFFSIYIDLRIIRMMLILSTNRHGYEIVMMHVCFNETNRWINEPLENKSCLIFIQMNISAELLLSTFRFTYGLVSRKISNYEIELFSCRLFITSIDICFFF